MSVELLREAAKVLRDHAEKAQHERPWCVNYVRGAIRHIERNVDSDAFTDCRDHGEDEWCGRFDMYDGAYVALMHPPVALALAEWLDRTAKGEEYSLAEYGYRNAPPEALNLARAILRRPS